MANVTGGATTWNLPNYSGALYTADMKNTPFLNMIGSLDPSGGQITDNFEFVVDSEYSHETLAQVGITETASLTAPTAINFTRNQNTNVTQIFQEAVDISYVRLSNQGRMSGVNTAGQQNNVGSELAFQKARTLEAIARKVEWHFLQGTYNKAVSAATANQTRGMIAAAGTTLDAQAAKFSKELFDALLLAAFTAGAQFVNPVAWMNGFQRQQISNIYGFAPQSRTVGGVRIDSIMTDFGEIAVAPAHRMMPTGTILIADMAVIHPVFQPVPGKGLLFYEELGKAGAAEKGQIFGQIGLNHGPTWAHATLTNLATS